MRFTESFLSYFVSLQGNYNTLEEKLTFGVISDNTILHPTPLVYRANL